MKKHYLLVLTAFAVAVFCVDAQVINPLVPNNQIGNVNVDEDAQLTNTYLMTNDIVLQRVPVSSKVEDKKLMSSDFKYDRYGNLTEKTLYNYDKNGKQTELTRYIKNDRSYYWMWDKDEWIVVSKTISSFTDAGAQLLFESYTLDFNTGILKGASKWIYDRFEVEQFSNNIENYNWDHTLNEWKGSSKQINTIRINADTIDIEQFSCSWNSTSKSWIVNENTKHNLRYLKLDVDGWYLTQHKIYILLNGNHVLSRQLIYTPNSAMKNTQIISDMTFTNGELTSITSNIVNKKNKITSQESKSLINNQWENSWRKVFDVNVNGVDSIVTTYVWYENQWNATILELYEYSLPDSIQTRISYYTPAHYITNRFPLPSLCSQQSLYPSTKSIQRINSINGLSELNYTYIWDAGNCNWRPSGIKLIRTFDPNGVYRLSYTYCSSNNGTDWINCQNYQYTYNSKNRLLTSLTSSDGSTIASKFENIYNQSDTVLLKTKYYKTEDINGDGIVGTDEWAYDGELKRKYKLNTTGDSVHIIVNAPDELQSYDLIGIKKLKITGTVNADDLIAINEYSKDSLNLLDLSDAILEDNELKDGSLRRSGLQKLILPKTLKTIKNGAISSGNENEDDVEVKSIKELFIYPAVETIERGAIAIMSLEKVTMPSRLFDKLYTFASVAGINDIYKSTLKSIKFNDGAGKIQEAVCYNMPYLQEVTIGEGAVEIANNAFKNCGMLSTINFEGTTLHKIGYNAFWGCNELTTLSLPEGLTSIDYSAFWGCSGLTAVSMPQSLSSIAQNAFWGCSRIADLNVAAAMPPALGDNALMGVPRKAKLTVPNTALGAYQTALQWKEFFSNNTDVDNASERSILLSSDNGQLLLQNMPVNSEIIIFSTTGTKILSVVSVNNKEHISLPKGAYVVRVGNQYFKTIVK